MVARAAFDGPIRGIAYPGRGHAESGGRNQVSRNVFDHQCGAGAYLVPAQQFMIAGEPGLRIIAGGGNVDDAAERAGNGPGGQAAAPHDAASRWYGRSCGRATWST